MQYRGIRARLREMSDVRWYKPWTWRRRRSSVDLSRISPEQARQFMAMLDGTREGA